MKFLINTLIIVFMAGLLKVGYAQMHPWGDNWGHEARHDMDWPDSAQVVTLSGEAFVDSSYFMMPHYYLDTTGDDSVDYMLAFGPWWYEPDNGATRPMSGELVNVRGWLFENTDDYLGFMRNVPMLVVLDINGLAWRDSSGTPPWSGNWLHQGSDSNQYVFCPTDSASWLQFGPGSMMGHHHGGMMFPDSIYAEFELLHPDSLPGIADSTCLAGFHANVVDNNFGSMMGHGRHSMGFLQNIQQRFHFTESMLQERGIEDFSGVELRYYDDSGEWVTASTAQYNPQDNSVEYSAPTVNSYYGLFATGTETSAEQKTETPTQYGLLSNYPNPFNPSTTIQFSLQANAPATVSIYDVLGRKVRVLLDAKVSAGEHKIEWDGRDDRGNLVNSGVYILELRTEGMSQHKTITLLK